MSLFKTELIRLRKLYYDYIYTPGVNYVSKNGVGIGKSVRIEFAKLLPKAKSLEPEEWFENNSMYLYERIFEVESAGLIFILGNLCVGDPNNEKDVRQTIYIKDSPPNMSCWFHLSTGTSNRGQNFSDFYLPLDDVMILTGFRSGGGAFPKKNVKGKFFKDLPKWSQKLLNEIGYNDKYKHNNIKNLFMRFKDIEDLAFSIFTEFGWNQPRYENIYEKIKEYLNEHNPDLMKSIYFKDYPKIKSKLIKQKQLLNNRFKKDKKSLKKKLSKNKLTLKQQMALNKAQLKKKMSKNKKHQ